MIFSTCPFYPQVPHLQTPKMSGLRNSNYKMLGNLNIEGTLAKMNCVMYGCFHLVSIFFGRGGCVFEVLSKPTIEIPVKKSQVSERVTSAKKLLQAAGIDREQNHSPSR